MTNQTKLITEAIRIQLENSGLQLQDLYPTLEDLLEAIRKEEE